MRPIRMLAVAAAALGATALTSPPAVADTRGQRDPVRDARPAYDIVTATYTNNSRFLGATYTYRDLQNAETVLTMSFGTAAMANDDARFDLTAARAPGGAAVEYFGVIQRNRYHRIRCRGFSTSWDIVRDQLRVRVPTKCLGEGYGTQRLSAITGTYDDVKDLTAPFSVAFN